MAISYIGGRTQAFTGRTSTVIVSLTGLTGGFDTAPSAGDFVVAFYGVGSNVTTRNITIGSDQGWTSLTKISANSTYDTNYVVAYKRMGSTPDTSVTVSGTGSTADAGAVVVHVFRGVDETTPLDVSPVSATGNGTLRPNPAAITPITDGAVIIASGAGSFVSSERLFTSSDLSNFITVYSPDNIDITVGAGTSDWTSGSFDPDQFGLVTGSDFTSSSWAAYTLALRPAPPPPNNAVTPNNIETGSPVLGTPTITVVPATETTPNSLVTAAPVLGSPTVAQVHSLTPAAIVTGAVVLGAAALSQGHVLAGQGIVTGAPEVGQAALAQAHALAPNGLTTGAPVLGSPAIAVGGVVSPESLETGSPVLGQPTLAQGHVLAFDGLVTGSPDVALADLLQAHGLTIGGLVAGAPILGAAALTQQLSVAPVNLAARAPILGTPTLRQNNDLAVSLLETGAPELGAASLVVLYDLEPLGVATPSPELGTPALGQVFVLAPRPLTTGSPVLARMVLIQNHVLLPESITLAPPVLGALMATEIRYDIPSVSPYVPANEQELFIVRGDETQIVLGFSGFPQVASFPELYRQRLVIRRRQSDRLLPLVEVDGQFDTNPSDRLVGRSLDVVCTFTLTPAQTGSLPSTGAVYFIEWTDRLGARNRRIVEGRIVVGD